MPSSSRSESSASHEHLDAFVTKLVALRAQAGNPSFRKMARRSGKIAHTTLHDAVRGNRLPSWETVEQFVIACEEDPQKWKAEWANLAQTSQKEYDSSQDTEPVESTRKPSALSDHKIADQPRPAAMFTLPRSSVNVMVIAVVIALAVGFGAGRITAPDVTSAETSQPPPTTVGSVPGPAVEGDSAEFVTDVTLSDGTEVERSSTTVKTWRFRNTGSVTWEQRLMVRDQSSSGMECKTPNRVTIDTTKPGQTVDISVPVTTPDRPTRCKVLWSMTDGDGQPMFPGGRPVFFDIVVK